jgi:amidohydrolase
MIDSISYRQKLHQIAEISGHETKTSQYIIQDLSVLDKFKIAELSNHGVIASTVASGGLMLRADFDALPISESHLSITYKADNSKVSHKCGHDGHSAILRELAYENSKTASSKPFHLLFQPSEENGKGAPAVIADDIFKQINPDRIFGMHNIPGYELGTVLWKRGVITAAVATLVINLEGVSAHASSPWLGVSPLPVLTTILDAGIRMSSSDNGYLLVTPVYFKLGSESNGIAPGDGQLNLTIRSFSNNRLKEAISKLITLSEELSKKSSLKINIKIEDKFDACVNNDECCDLLLKAAENAGLKTFELQHPFAFGEDFGSYSLIKPACFFGLGAGESQPALHHPDYDFPDELIKPAVNLWNNLINL